MNMNATTLVFDWLDELKFNRFHRRLLILTSLVSIFAGYNSQIIAYIVPLALREWHLTPLKAGTMISYGFLGLMVGAAGFGLVSDRIGRKKSIMIVVVVFSVFNSAAYFAPNFEIFCLLRFLSGLGIGGAIPLTITLLSEFAPSGIRARILTASGGSFTIGWALAGLFAMGLVPHFGWRMVLLIGILPIFLLPALQAYLPESVRFLVVKKRYNDAVREIQRVEKLAGIDPHTWRPEAFTQLGPLSVAGFREVFRPGLRVMTVLVWCTYFFSMLALYGLSTWLPALLANSGFSLVKSYSFGIVQSLGAALGGFLLGCLMDLFGRKPGLCLSFFLGGLSLLLFSAVTSDLVLYIAGAATGIFLVSIPAALHVVAGEIYSTRIRSLGLGSAYAVGRVGSITGPIIGGIVQMAGFSFGQFFLLFSVPSFICVILVAFYPVGVRKEGLEEVTAKLLK
jgi:AAHS family benzoate transporter-like MFS transporter